MLICSCLPLTSFCVSLKRVSHEKSILLLVVVENCFLLVFFPFPLCFNQKIVSVKYKKKKNSKDFTLDFSQKNTNFFVFPVFCAIVFFISFKKKRKGKKKKNQRHE